MARLFSVLSREPALNADLRQKIHTQLRSLSTDPDSHRLLFRMAGTGEKQERAFTIVRERFLDEELQTLDSELLTHMLSGL